MFVSVVLLQATELNFKSEINLILNPEGIWETLLRWDEAEVSKLSASLWNTRHCVFSVYCAGWVMWVSQWSLLKANHLNLGKFWFRRYEVALRKFLHAALWYWWWARFGNHWVKLWLSNFNPLKCLLKHKLLGLTPRGSDSVGLGPGLRICISTDSQVMLRLLIWAWRTTEQRCQPTFDWYRSLCV